ncbi:hemolysin XhlA family protein [Marinisporobacter balticus]|uniref:Hemolysin XhlA n=1 Tax=Marinisporobacter balticus TaxID=2018667 RepID=A0A4R2KX43_9FIRM|nr:hemolysin XhlA family protein [Marinisporobacter balticus]TCO79141.1 hemolysin XhlA [Marinisporobacter balticus]
MVCERHEEIVHRLDNHANRIRQLEIHEAQTGEKITSLIEKLDNLTSWIKALVMLSGTTLLGFFIWYIQNL